MPFVIVVLEMNHPWNVDLRVTESKGKLCTWIKMVDSFYCVTSYLKV